MTSLELATQRHPVGLVVHDDVLTFLLQQALEHDVETVEVGQLEQLPLKRRRKPKLRLGVSNSHVHVPTCT